MNPLLCDGAVGSSARTVRRVLAASRLGNLHHAPVLRPHRLYHSEEMIAIMDTLASMAVSQADLMELRNHGWEAMMALTPGKARAPRTNLTNADIRIALNTWPHAMGIKFAWDMTRVAAKSDEALASMAPAGVTVDQAEVDKTLAEVPPLTAAEDTSAGIVPSSALLAVPGETRDQLSNALSAMHMNESDDEVEAVGSGGSV